MKKILILLLLALLPPLHSKAQSLQGKTLWTLFDSLGDGNNWQPLFTQLTGAIFYPDINRHNISYGGTTSEGALFHGTLGRAKHLAALKDRYPIDIVFMENVNDINLFDEEKGTEGSIDDPAWMQGEKIYIHKGAFSSRDEAADYLKKHLQEILSTIPETKRKAGAMLTVAYQTTRDQGMQLKITTRPTVKGTCYLNTGVNKTAIETGPEMDETELIEEFCRHAYGAGWILVNNGDGTLNLHYYYHKGRHVSFDANGTGMEVELKPMPQSLEYNYYFMGKDSSEWHQPELWTPRMSLYSTYKGLFKYLEEQLPNARLYWIITSYYNFDFDDPTLLKPNGMISKKAYRNTPIYKKWQQLRAFQHNICKACGIKVIDISEKCGINLKNIRQYYYTRNVHPKQEGYDQWAKALSRYFK
ncbi:hypothetical protein [Prevotella sp. KH2C16]|uniref:hypothetical protein n=1 Tax=Prevotella sp. KH2C16 TaxID=1855325 RepID=UPI0008E2C8DB|nr:hypothetical protein [Prevotella sp. KH2C16]SFF87143.1 hypothetical protein SAMN05216383_101303 [Prevotella sp. KH2C16]